MTLADLRRIFPDACEDTWHQHKNGGGWVQNTATVDESVHVGCNAKVSGDAQVYGDAWVSGNAQVYGNAKVSGDAQVYGDAWDSSPLYIQGSRHSLTHCARGQVRISCYETIFLENWREFYREIALQNRYRDAEIAEYHDYLELFEKRDKAVFGEVTE